ncbi:MAG TPA: acyl-CoA dehydrogenase family protein, partial [Solirubrobacteraceae bacterium]|nr:acyl-CoA dehydrogenase family protein [Solirubrobacteraceae bacterium]
MIAGARPPSTSVPSRTSGARPSAGCENPGMEFDLPDHHRLLQQTVREFAEQEIAPVAEELDRTHTFPYDIVRRLADL